MAAQATTVHSQREGAEIYTGHDECMKKSKEMLEKLHLPKGILPLQDLVEVGYNPTTGYVWMKQKKASTHFFKKVGKTVSYAEEVTAYVEERRMKRISGVKSKELFIWIALADMYIDDPASNKITFKSVAGIGRSFPVSAFEEEEPAN